MCEDYIHINFQVKKEEYPELYEVLKEIQEEGTRKSIKYRELMNDGLKYQKMMKSGMQDGKLNLDKIKAKLIPELKKELYEKIKADLRSDFSGKFSSTSRTEIGGSSELLDEDKKKAIEDNLLGNFS